MAFSIDGRFGNRARRWAAAAFGAILTSWSAQAWAQSTWQGDVSSDWFDANNWVGNAIPGLGTVTILNTTTPNAAVVGDRAVNGTAAAGLLSIGTTGTGGLSILDGGRLDSLNGKIGEFGGSVGTATVSGGNGIHRSQWLDLGTIDIGKRGTGTLTIAERGLVNIGLGMGTATLAENPGSTGTLNIGAAAGQAPVAPGRLSAAKLDFGAGTGLLTFNHIDTTRLYRFEPAISGNGAIGVHSGYTNLPGDSSGFTGATSIDGGTLAVNGALGGAVNVLSGGTLGGIGAVNGPVTLAGGSTLAPGRSIGTLTVNSVTFQPGSTYVAEVNRRGESDRIVAAGTATINGGSVEVDGDFFGGVPYRILDANVVTGRFDGIATPFSVFLDPMLTYGANSVDLLIARSDVPFRSAAKTRNQAAVADGMDSLAFGNPVYDALTQVSFSEAPGAFEALSGEVHPSAKGAIIEGNQLIAAAVNRRIRRTFDTIPAAASTAGTGTPLGYAGGRPDAQAGATGKGPNSGAWIAGYGSVVRTRSRTNTSARQSKNYGLLVGVDALGGDNWRAGVVGGAGRNDFSVDRLLSSGTSDNYNLGVYGAGRWKDVGLSAGAIYGWHEIDTTRTVAFPGISERVRAGYDGRSIQLYGDLGYTLDMKGTSVEPFAALSYMRLHTRPFTESGLLGSAALSARSKSTDVAFSTLGARLSRDVNAGLPVTFDGMLGWRHAYGDVDPVSRFSLAGSSLFTVQGVPIGRDALVMEFGVGAELTEAVSVSAAYQGQFSEKSEVYGVQARATIKTDAPPVAAIAAKPEKDWQFVVAAPFFLPWSKGNVQIGPAQSDIYLAAWTALENLRMYVIGEISAIYKEKYTATIESFYVDIGASGRSVRGTEVAIGYEEAFTDMRLGYRPIRTARGWLEAYAGARFWSIMANLSVTTPGRLLPATTVSGSTGDRWWDPIVGLRGEYNLNSRWYLTGMADIGGFGLGSDFSWRAQAGAGYHFTDNLALDVQYKAISVNYDNGQSGASRFGVDITQHGPHIRAVLSF